MQAEPLGGEEVDHVHVGAGDHPGQALARRAAELGRLDLGATRHLVVQGRDAEFVLETQEGGPVATLPEAAQAFLTGTDRALFTELEGRSQVVHVHDGRLDPA